MADTNTLTPRQADRLAAYHHLLLQAATTATHDGDERQATDYTYAAAQIAADLHHAGYPTPDTPPPASQQELLRQITQSSQKDSAGGYR